MRLAGQFLLYVFALLVPWWVYLDMPQYAFFPYTFAMAALIILFVVDSIRRGWQVPFELTLPLGLLTAWWAYMTVRHMAAVPAADPQYLLDPIFRLSGVLTPLTMLAVLHFARPRRVALTALDAFALSAAAWAGLMLLAWLFRLFPTRSLMGIASWSVPGIAIYAFAAAVFGAARNRERRPARIVFSAAAVVILAWLLILWLPAVRLPRPNYALFPLRFYLFPWLAVALLRFWPLARIAAKVEVARRESENRLEPVFLLVLMALAALGAVRFGPSQTEAILFALAGAWALPEREQAAAYRPDWRLAAVLAPLCALAGFNLFNVNPANPVDPRNYVPQYPADMIDAALLDAYMPNLEAVEARYPDEVQTDFWFAYVRLLHGDLYAAALEYRDSVRPADNLILPPPDEDERRAFMDKLRDTASATAPEDHHGAYALALAAEGRYEEALALMRRDAKTATAPPAPDSAKPIFAAAIQAYLRDPGLAQHLAGWTARDLLALLVAWGAVTEPAAEGVNPECLPAVLLYAPGLCESISAGAISQEDATARCLEAGAGLQVAPCGAILPHKPMPAQKDGAPAVVVLERT